MGRRSQRFRPSRHDATAGLVLGVQSVPDGLATGVLAGINPTAGLYGYMVGTAAGALATSSTFMAVQGTGAMAMIIADVPGLRGNDAAAALATLTVLTGVAMLIAGLLRLGSVLRFVSNAVMVGFINAVGVNIVLGQLASLTGYSAEGSNRIVRTINTVLNPSEIDVPSLGIGLATIGLILVFDRTPVGSMGLVIAVIVTSVAAQLGGWSGIATLDDLGVALDSLPSFELPDLGLVPSLLIPAVSLAFVGLIQGAGISGTFPNPDGTYPDGSRDFVGQGVGNLASGVLQGMPVGGSVSGTSLNKAAGARSRWSLLFASVVMVIVVVAFGEVVGKIAMPALAGLLMLIGIRTVKPRVMAAVWRAGVVQKVVLTVTFVLTMLVPLQYAVLIGVAISIVLHVIRQSNQVVVRRQVADPDGHLIETDPPAVLPPGEVVVLQPYGSLFFAAAPVFESMLPAVDEQSAGSVVILRLRGRTDLGTTFMDVLRRYATTLRDSGCRLKLVSVSDRVLEQLHVGGVTELLEPDDIYLGDERIGAALERARTDADAWIRTRT